MNNHNSGKVNLGLLLINQDSGNYFDTSRENVRPNSGVNYVKTKSWRLIPKTTLEQTNNLDSYNSHFSGFYSIDGERYVIEPIQVTNIKKNIRIFCLNC